MKVLVTVATKYGSTSEIARAIGDALRERHIEVTVAPIDQVTTVEDYDAVVAGSAVYAGHWMKAAKEFVEGNAPCSPRGPLGYSRAVRLEIRPSPRRIPLTPSRW